MFQGCLKGVSRKFKGFLRKFEGCFKGVSRTLRKFHECFKTVSRKFKAYQKSFKKALLLLSLSSQLPEQKEGLFIWK